MSKEKADPASPGSSLSDADPINLPDNVVAVTARTQSPDDPPLFDKLVSELNRELPTTILTGSRWLRGKAEEPWGKSHLLKAQALAEIGKVELEERKRLDARQVAQAELALKHEDMRLTHEERRYELETQRAVAITGVANALEKLQALGMTAEVEAISRALTPPPKSGHSDR